jgi:hypothetical protein
MSPAGLPKPLRFVGGVIGVWVALRCAAGVYLPPSLRGVAPFVFPGLGIESPANAETPLPPVARRLPPDRPPRPVMLRSLPAPGLRFASAPPLPPTARPFGPRALDHVATALFMPISAGAALRELALADDLAARRQAFSPAFTIPRDPPSSPGGAAPRWSASAWAFLRRDAGRGSLATAGQLGGSQAGARVAFRPAASVPLAATARLSAPIEGSRGAEAALGIDWQISAKLPVRIGIDRRVALDRGGRDAWEMMAAGGVDRVALPGGLRLDGYAQAGVIGTNRRDLYADGAFRIARPVLAGPDAELALGAGAWGAAQPGVERVDLGPSAVLRVPLGRAGLTVAAEWRFRLAGQARPASGPSLTIATDF